MLRASTLWRSRLDTRIVPGRQILSSRVKISIFRACLDHQVSLAGSFFDASGKFQAGESGIGCTGGKLACLDYLIEVGAEFTRCAAQSVGQQILKDGAVAAHSRRERDPSAQFAGANDADSADGAPGLDHYCPLSSCPSTALRLVLAVRIFSARRLRSSASINGMEALMRRSVVLMSST